MIVAPPVHVQPSRMRLSTWLLPAALSLAALSPLHAQVRASERASVSQTVDGTVFAIDYSRPRVRGRTLWGKTVEWGEVWTPGANWATTLDVSRDVTVAGRRVPKGSYSVWMVVRRAGDWTLVLDPRARRFHMEPPDSTAQQVRLPVRPQDAPFTEVLTWSFPEVRASGGTLAMQWGTTRVAVDVGVEPSLRVGTPAAEAAPYVGEYEYAEVDSAGKRGRTSRFLVTHEDGTLKGRWDPNDAYMGKFALIRVGPDMFVPGLYDAKGEIYEVLRPDMLITFARAGGRVASLEVRDDQDRLWATATRKP